MDGFCGEVRLFAGTFAPANWAFCDGSLLQIADNTALFSIIGKLYGGDGRQNFALPDLRGRTVIGVSQGQNPGQAAGMDQVPVQSGQASTSGGPTATVNSVVTGSGNNAQPVLGLNYIICLRGTFPPRS